MLAPTRRSQGGNNQMPIGYKKSSWDVNKGSRFTALSMELEEHVMGDRQDAKVIETGFDRVNMSKKGSGNVKGYHRGSGEADGMQQLCKGARVLVLRFDELLVHRNRSLEDSSKTEMVVNSDARDSLSNVVDIVVHGRGGDSTLQ
ncbi:hypothetical protein V6N13_098631 [Hibiscus sabdariffa]